MCLCKIFFFFQFQLDNGRLSFSRLVTLITHSTKTRKYILSKGKVGVCVSFVYWHNWDVNPNSRLRLNLSTATKVFQQSWCRVFIRNRTKQTKANSSSSKSQDNIDQLSDIELLSDIYCYSFSFFNILTCYHYLHLYRWIYFLGFHFIKSTKL